MIISYFFVTSILKNKYPTKMQIFPVHTSNQNHYSLNLKINWKNPEIPVYKNQGYTYFDFFCHKEM